MRVFLYYLHSKYFSKIFELYLLTSLKKGLIYVSKRGKCFSFVPGKTLKGYKGGTFMKRYTLEAIIDGEEVLFDKKFASRNKAINYMFAYYEHNYKYNLFVNDEYAIHGDKHNIEYVCNYHNRFRINREVF